MTTFSKVDGALERVNSPTTDGWADERLRKAYDLIDAVLLAHNNPETEANEFLTYARDAVENADVSIEKGR